MAAGFVSCSDTKAKARRSARGFVLTVPGGSEGGWGGEMGRGQGVGDHCVKQRLQLGVNASGHIARRCYLLYPWIIESRPDPLTIFPVFNLSNGVL